MQIVGGRNRFPMMYWTPNLSPVKAYYFDATLGIDTNPGTEALPFQTITKFNALTLNATEHARFKRGETFSGTRMTVPSSGDVGKPIVIEDYGTGTLPIITAPAATESVRTNGKNYINFKNLNIKSGTDKVFFIDGHDISLDGVTVEGDVAQRADGIRIFGAAAIVYNISILNSTIFNNKVLASGGGGIMISNTGAGGPSQITLIGNSIHNNGTSATTDHGVYIKYCTTVLVKNNLLYSNSANGIQAQNNCFYVIIDSNKAYLNGLDGIYAAILDADNNVKIINNLIYSNVGAGLHTGLASPGLIVYHNTVINNGTNGMVIADVGIVKNNLVVQDFAVVGNNRCIRSENGTTIPPTFNNNSYYYPNNTDGDKVANQTTPANGYTFAQWQALGADAAGMMSDPKLVTPYTDLHIQTTSPCKNAGADLRATVPVDYDGITRDATPDIGAYEFVA
jgi:hypothetical protein